MNETIDCTNCCISDFKHSLCDCHGDFCTKYKSIGDENDFMQAVLMNRPSGEVDAVREYEYQAHNLNQGYITLGEFDKRIEPLRHLYYDRPSGEWIYGTDEDGNEDAYPWTCSICGEKYPWHPNYCPHCGARMKDVTEGLESRTDLIWYGDKTDLIGDETGRHTGWFGKGADDE